ncbi:hypothetical protein OJ996_21755 [Luteolibacter sp. GHJ8]|uniref:Uncharacterized protein n=1 Tax=Luteolibacter rhizosphaerae TaxID=2989719 RepID=A0ABT3G9Q2_9BACT|nr:hypothetical protein [Luteolibacter rhizosphaerae]MCW1916231.1 hypothetical protein [Luteolibacter rhizosphaerae]
MEEFSASEAPGTPPNFSKMAARVLQARLKLLGATLAKLEEPRRGEPPLEKIDKIEERIFELDSGGVEAILREFSAPEL